MRSIGAPLTTAQKAAARTPYVTALVQNNNEHVRRLDYAVLNSTVNASEKHDICVAGDNSITRVRMQAGTVKQQRVLEADAGTPANWDVWVDLVTGMGSQVACAAKGARVIVVFVDTLFNVRYRESTDNGATFGASTIISGLAAAPLDLAVTYKNSTGDLMVFWSTSASVLQGNKRTASIFGGIVSHTSTFNTITGIAATYAFDYELWVTGTEVTTLKPSVWATIYGDGSGAAVGTWTALRPQVQAEVGLNAFQSPSLDYLDTYRANYTELPAWTGGVTRTFRTWLHPTNLYHLGPFSWRTPTPQNHLYAMGIARAHSATYAYESGIDSLQRAPHTLVTKDVAPDLIAFELYEDTLDAHGWIDIRNTGAYAGPASPIVVGAQVKIAVGYYTSSGNASSPLQDFWITAIEHRRELRQPGRSRVTLRLYVEGGLRRLRRSFQREQLVHDGTIDDFRSVLSGILNRAGMVLSVTNASTRSDTVLPRFTILPAHSGLDAARNLLAFLPDRMIAKASGSVSLVEPLVADASDYDAADAAHPVYARRVRIEAPPASEAHANALTAAALFLMGQSTDYASAENGLAPIVRLRDLTSDTAAEANATAVAQLRQRKLDQDAGQMTVAPICGLELLDMLQFTDDLTVAGAQLARAMSITWRFDRTRAIYEQQIGLGPA